MQNTKHWMVLILCFLAASQIVSCSRAPAEHVDPEPVSLEPIEGSDFNRVTLSARAAERLDIQTEPVREVEWEGLSKMAVPYSAIIYGLNGETWAYIRNPGGESLTFVRQSLSVECIEGGLAILSASLPMDTEVVTVGAAELYGADTGVGH